MSDHQFQEIMRALTALIWIIWMNSGLVLLLLFAIYCRLGGRKSEH